jgi:hypothetical protein
VALLVAFAGFAGVVGAGTCAAVLAALEGFAGVDGAGACAAVLAALTMAWTAPLPIPNWTAIFANEKPVACS